LASYFKPGDYSRTGLYSFPLLNVGTVKEIRLFNLTDWGWVLLLGTVILVVWLLIIFQANSIGAHEFGQIPDSEFGDHTGDHGNDHTV